MSWRSTGRVRHANLVVVDKLNGGKADALNVGLNLASGELVCAIDADTLIERGALVRLARPMIIDPEVVATGGTIRPVNAVPTKNGQVLDVTVPRNMLAGVQVVEYLRAFLLGRLGLNRLGGNLIISGAFGLFRREPMIEAGGWLHDTVGEDMELVVRLRRLGYEQGGTEQGDLRARPHGLDRGARVAGACSAGSATAGTAASPTRSGGTAASSAIRATARWGSSCFPYFVLVELLAPVVEALGWSCSPARAVGLIDRRSRCSSSRWPSASASSSAWRRCCSTRRRFMRFTPPRDLAWLVWWSVAENLGYRQMTVYWRLRGLWKYLRGRIRLGAHGAAWLCQGSGS